MKQIEGVLTYKEAKIYIQGTKTLLTRMKSMEKFIANATADIEKLKAIEEKEDKERALTSFVGRKYRDFDAAYDDYLAKLETNLRRVKHQYERLTSALSNIPDGVVKDVVHYYYVGGHTIEDTAEHFMYSVSTISRYKKQGLIMMAEAMFGIIIVDTEVVDADNL